MMVGEGTLKYADGRVYEGHFANGEPSDGKMTYVDGSSWDGTWRNGKPLGDGVSH
jgi:hypothetical protein